MLYKIKSLLNVESFEKWLKEYQEEIVGIANQSCSCPLANFLISNLDVKYTVDVDVDEICIYINTNNDFEIREETFKTPKIFSYFIREIDNCKNMKITKNQALNSLEKALKKSKEND